MIPLQATTGLYRPRPAVDWSSLRSNATPISASPLSGQIKAGPVMPQAPVVQKPQVPSYSGAMSGQVKSLGSDQYRRQMAQARMR